MIKWMNDCGLYVALRAMRLPYNSGDKSDSAGGVIGPSDLRLMLTLIKRGGSHRKFLRMWQFWVGVEASVKFWFQFDTYKVGVTSMSESTMHRLRQNDWRGVDDEVTMEIKALKTALDNGRLSDIDVMYRLPMGMKYFRIVNLNAESFLRMWFDRKEHRLPEWQLFLKEFRALNQHLDRILTELGE